MKRFGDGGSGYGPIMKHDDAPQALDELLEPGSTLMVAVASGHDQLEFRPLTVAKIDGGRLDILLDTTEEWAKSIGDGRLAYVTVSDTKTNTWLSMTGTTSTTTDTAAIDELWNALASAYFEQGRDTPGITVLRIQGSEGRYWSSPSGRIGSLISLVKAKFGTSEQSGEHGAVKL